MDLKKKTHFKDSTYADIYVNPTEDMYSFCTTDLSESPVLPDQVEPISVVIARLQAGLLADFGGLRDMYYDSDYFDMPGDPADFKDPTQEDGFDKMDAAQQLIWIRKRRKERAEEAKLDRQRYYEWQRQQAEAAKSVDTKEEEKEK